MRTICFITYSMVGGGAERVISLLANFLSKKNYKIKIYELSKNSSKKYEINGDIEVISSDVANKKIKQILYLNKILKENKNAIIISFFTYINVLLLLLNKKHKRKIIVSERNDPSKSCKSKIISFLRKKVYKYASAIIFQTEDAKKYFGQICKLNGHVIFNPIKSNLPELNFNKRNGKVITFCRLNPQKNIPMYINAIKLVNNILPNVKFDIFGNGPCEGLIRQEISKYNLDETVKIYDFNIDIHNIAKEYNLFVLPSDYEGMSNSMLEALAIGLPTICTDCPIGGARAIIKNGVNGILVPVNDATTLANEIVKILTNDTLAQTLSINAKQIKETLSVENICNQWINIIEKISDNE